MTALAVLAVGVALDWIGRRYLRPLGERWATAIERRLIGNR